MLKTISMATVLGLSVGTAALIATPAFAQSHTVPAGDSLAVTPPIDVTVGQILNLRSDDRGLLEGRSAYVQRPAHRMKSAPEEIDR